MRTETSVTWVVCSLCLITLSVCRPIKDVEGEAFASDNEVFRKNIKQYEIVLFLYFCDFISFKFKMFHKLVFQTYLPLKIGNILELKVKIHHFFAGNVKSNGCHICRNVSCQQPNYYNRGSMAYDTIPESQHTKGTQGRSIPCTIYQISSTEGKDSQTEQFR